MPEPHSFSTGRRTAFSMVGMLITMVCIVVLFSILMTSLSKVTTGQGSQHEGTVRSVQDELYLYALFTSMNANAGDNKGVYLVPNRVAASNDASLNNTANLFSAMVMANYTPPKQLISGNEYNPNVQEMIDYDYAAYNPNASQFWDPTFMADLQRLSHVSYAHLPLFGERFRKHWSSTLDSTFPLLGNRGPKDGVNTPQSLACGRDHIWRGHIVFGDGHITFVDNPSPNGLTYEQDHVPKPDNIFMMESGPNGADAILSFTKSMSAPPKGPELQFD